MVDSSTTTQGMAFLDISPQDTLRTYRLRAPQSVVAAWAEAVRGCIELLASREAKPNGGGSVIVKGGVVSGAGGGLDAGRGRSAGASSEQARAQTQGQSQVQTLAPSESAQMQRTIEERDRAMGQLHDDMATVHEMMGDIANLVSQQGDQLIHIDESLDATASRVDRGVDDLRVAHKRL